MWLHSSQSTDEALVDETHRLSYAELDALVARAAGGLAAEGVRRGDRIVVSLPNGIEIVTLFLAAMRLGAVWVGMHPSLAADEERWIVDDVDPALVIDRPTLGDLIRARPVEATVLEPGAPAAIAYTSGTTGRPKGAVLDYRHLLLPGSVILRDRLAGRSERVGVALPLTTLNMMILGPLLALQGGGTCVCTPRLTPGELVQWVRTECVEHLSLPPAVLDDLLRSPDVDPAELAGLRLGVGGTACPERLRREYRERVGRDFTTGYGLTEAPAAVTQETERVPHVAGASGVAMAHVRVVIADADGRALGAGEEGEICVGPARSGRWAGQWRGMLGYWRRDTATAAARHGPLLRTGDVGWLDAAGYLHVVDRRSDLINRGGSNVYPAEVVRVLRDHPDVADCLVFGRPHDRLGQEVVAIVEARAGSAPEAAELRGHCSASLASFKVPAELMVVDRLPRNSMGKVVRAEAAELAAGLSDA